MPESSSSNAKSTSRRRLLKTLLYGGIGLTAAAEWGQARRLSVEKTTLKLPRWDADGFRVGLISDLHTNNTPQADRAIEALRLALIEKPDVILIGGDFLNQNTPAADAGLDRFLRAAAGESVPIYAVLGNHDYWLDHPERVISRLRRSEVKLLRNETAQVNGVTILGIDDGIAGRDRHDTLSSKDDGKSTIALFHEPDFVTRIDKRISLMLAGHSHGGQVCLPFGYAVHTPRGARDYIRGYYPDANVPLYVTRGVGTVGPDVRLYSAPEVSILTLRGEA
ncbi:MAG: metallophosphoesterase [Fimbriimonadaceae bacterium]|nr:metallophosphoesterase [Fimbriimonadaceae bacterium]